MSKPSTVKVMIVEDDLSIIDAVSLVLELQGYQVETASDDQVLEHIEATHPDIVFLDIWMAGMDGRDVCCSLKHNPSTEDIPIIMLSAHKDTEVIATECGADGYLLKPFEMADLTSLIQQYVH